MALTTYEQVRPWARAIKRKTARAGDAAVVHREEYRHPEVQGRHLVERRGNRDDRAWVDAGAPQGNPADMPPPRQYADAAGWTIGTPDLVVSLARDDGQGRRAPTGTALDWAYRPRA